MCMGERLQLLLLSLCIYLHQLRREWFIVANVVYEGGLYNEEQKEEFLSQYTKKGTKDNYRRVQIGRASCRERVYI